MTPPIVVTPPPPSPSLPPPPWWPLLTNAMRIQVLAWLRVRKVDTTAWPK